MAALNRPQARDAAASCTRPSSSRQPRLSAVCSSASNFTYATGTSSSVRNRHSDWPPMTVTAIAARPVPPMPRPSAVGIRPAMIAKVVIRIGRSRVRHASTIASRSGMPCRAQRVGVVDLQDRVLLHDAEQQEHAERAPQVQRPAGRPQREQRERHRDRQHQHDHDRLHEALELRRRAPCRRRSSPARSP